MNDSEPNIPSSNEAIETAAAAWLIERQDGFTPDQAAEFARWRDADPRHARAIAVMEATHGILARLPQVREALQPGSTGVSTATASREDSIAVTSNQSARDARAPGTIVRFPVLLKIATALAACVAIGFVLLTLRKDPLEATRTYSTAADGYLRVVLPDDSVLELNANTDVELQFSTPLRQLTLQRGEAHFTVAKNSARPFSVVAGGIAVRAVGTAFNVRREKDSVDVLVTEGRVQVSKAGGAVAATNDLSAGTGQLLSAGQRLILSAEDNAPLPLVVSAADAAFIRDALAWQSPRLVFRDEPLAEVARQFNEHNRVQLIVGDAELGRRPVGGTFRADHVETFVNLLESSGDIAVERPDAGRIVLRKVAR